MNRTIAVLLSFLWTLSLGAGEAANENTVRVAASGTQQVLASALKVSIRLKQTAPGVQEGLVALKSLREKILGQVAASYGADAKTAVLDDPYAEASSGGSARKAPAPNNNRLRRKPVEEDAKPETKYDVGQIVHLNLPLKGKDAVALTVEADGLKAKLAKEVEDLMKVAGEVDPKDAAGEADAGEADEEADDEDMDEEDSGPVYFSYFAPSSEEVLQKAVQSALQDAQTKALAMAKAMGKSKATLKSMHVSGDEFGPEAGYDEYDNDPSERSSQDKDGLTGNAPQLHVGVRLSALYQVE